MRYRNPVIRGFYPDPSVCRAGDVFCLAASSFQYFPGVPLFVSEDLVNWRQVGHALTRPDQVELRDVPSSGGVFAPTIRFHDGWFYVVTNNNTKNLNFYVRSRDLTGPWSAPVAVDQEGIDPSLLFDGGHAYFISNGRDEDGLACILQCEIDPETGRRLTPSRCIWHGAGGRYLEAPHMYHIGEWYYLLAAEGGTEYGHMEVCARSHDPWGPFENCPWNPVLTNRDRAPAIIQGIGHGDLIQGRDGSWYMISLGFRQIHPWQRYHTLGREVFLTPVTFREDGWFTCGRDGTTEESYEIPGDGVQEIRRRYTFENTDPAEDWAGLRCPVPSNVAFSSEKVRMRGTRETLDDAGSPTFLGLRQREFAFTLSVALSLEGGEGGISVYMCETEHYDLALRRTETGMEAVLKLNIGDIRHEHAVLPVGEGPVRFLVRADSLAYRFFVSQNGTETFLGRGTAKYLSSEVAGGFTGVMLALYAAGEGTVEFERFVLEYGDPAGEYTPGSGQSDALSLKN